MGVGAATAASAGLVAVWMAALSFYDLRQHRLPNALTLPGAVLIIAVAAATGRGVPALLGAVALGGLYLVVHLIDPAAMGGGDVKLAIGLGALTGACGIDVWLLAAFGAVLLTAAFAIVSFLLRAGPSVPHGPSMCVASAVAVACALT